MSMFCTRVGVEVLPAVLPMPSWPTLLTPHAQISPASSRASTQPLPAATWMILGRPGTCCQVERSPPLVPSWPHALLPTLQTVPSASRAYDEFPHEREFPKPLLIDTIGAGKTREVCTGVLMLPVVPVPSCPVWLFPTT